MIITKKNNIFKVKIINKKINIYNQEEIKNITKEIIKKINKIAKIKNLIVLDIYQDNNYGTIINIKENKKRKKPNEEIEVKINIHINHPILYKINFFDIKENTKKNIYYYNNSFYLEPIKNITKKDFFYLIEQSQVTYDTSLDIINYGVKIKL